MNSLAIIQARMGSTRLPGKVLAQLGGKPVIAHVFDRVEKAALVDEVILATTLNKEDLPLVAWASKNEKRVYCGSEHDVLDRFYQVAKILQPREVIRITADCPLTDPDLVDEVISVHRKGGFSYSSNTIHPTYPDGLDVEVFSSGLLEEAWQKATSLSEREHVTLWMRNHLPAETRGDVRQSVDHSEMRWTLDHPADMEFLGRVFSWIQEKKKGFSSKDVYRCLEENPSWQEINRQHPRNEALNKS